MGWHVHGAVDVKVCSAPIPTPQGVKEGNKTRWLQWKPGRKRLFTERKIEESLRHIVKLNNEAAAVEFYSKFGNLVSAYIPKYCKVYHGDMQAVPLEVVYAAANTLLAIQSNLNVGMKRERNNELESRVKLLLEGFEYLKEKYKQLAKPPREVLLVPEGNTLIPSLLYDTPAWVKDYCLHAEIIKETGQIKWDSLYFEKAKFETIVDWQPGYEPDILLPNLFGAIADYLLNKAWGSVALCACGCGKPAAPGSKYAEPSHRKNLWWKNSGAELRKKKKETKKGR